MSECKHESIDPYGCFCDGCGETCDEIIRNQQAELAALREENAHLLYEQWSLCDSEGMKWYGEIPPDPAKGGAPDGEQEAPRIKQDWQAAWEKRHE